VPDAAVVVVEVPPHLRQVQHGHGPAARPARRAALPGGGRERFSPEAVPGVRYGPAHGHGAVSLHVVALTPSSYRRDGSISGPAGQERPVPVKRPLDRGVPQEALETIALQYYPAMRAGDPVLPSRPEIDDTIKVLAGYDVLGG